MDDEDVSRRDDLLAQLRKQDLDPFSVAELRARIGALQAEIARTQAKLDQAGSTRAAADALFSPKT